MTTPVWFHLCARHFHSPITISHLTMLCLCVHICFRLILPPCFPSRQRGPLLYHGSAASSIWFLLTQPYPSILFYFYCIQKVSSNVLSDGRDVGNFSHVLRVNQWRRLSRWNLSSLVSPSQMSGVRLTNYAEGITGFGPRRVHHGWGCRPS
ncbi:hypothetical protein DFH94DRAFT_429332 [Russula ochroleuca]|uniref:Uncharacterized protein n=1 Tax=Russula ochroleuca TaxID=152965 RepID=A0A9P5MWU5_9AGAM|nr:hypothetical protein DFH94DRAFT_429332 [Russula ochroleuca]